MNLFHLGILVIYFVAGFFYVKPDSIKDIRLSGVAYEGLACIAIPFYLWLLLWVFWIPHLLLKALTTIPRIK